MTAMMSRIEHVPLRAPAAHGLALQVPAPHQIPTVWDRNAERLQQASLADWGEDLQELRQLAKTEIVKAARHYTRQYRDVTLAAPQGEVIAAGHQPQLFHPGVWFKNFALDRLATQLQATPINLIIDNDICAAASIRVPTGSIEKPHLEVISYDRSQAVVPYECRPVLDEAMFATYPQRVAAALGARVSHPLVAELWQPLHEVRDWTQNLGQRLAALRHRLEGEWGLQTLELPLSRVCQTESFARLAAVLMKSAVRLRDVYNAGLLEYRQVNRIRSRSHPVPALEQSDSWVEVPFWVYSENNASRQRLFVQTGNRELVLSDRSGWTERVACDALADWLQAPKPGVLIRPRALITTAFARLVLSQMFLHGIGGAKYDQLTDEIIRRLWGIEPPEFVALTATLKLPVETPDAVPADVSRLKQRLRELTYHPEEHLDPNDPRYGELQAWGAEKRGWVSGHADATAKERHDAIARLNQLLQAGVTEKRHQLQAEMDQVKGDARIHQMLGSREFSFCLFPGTPLRRELERLATVD